jgi:Flp pilus assembly protein TadB
MGKSDMKKRVQLLRNKYFYIAIVILIVFIVVWVVAGIVAAVFWALAGAVILIYLAFDPRIRRHW